MSSSNLANAHTEVKMKRITYNWSIKRFAFLPEKVDEKICSPWFHWRDNHEKWRLEFYPRGERGSSTKAIDYVSLYLARNSPGKSPITVRTALKISKSNIMLRNWTFTHEYDSQGFWGWTEFLERSKLLTTNSSDDDKFTINCIIDIPAEVTTSSFDASIFDSNKSQLSDDLRLVFKDPMFSDFTIIVGDEKFATHKVILASRSPVFAAMFEHKDLEENRKKEVKIKNMEPDVIKGMLEFIYTDQVTNIKELAAGLLEAADKYDLEKLRIMCERTLYEELNKENAAEVLQLADLHRADTLKKLVMKYIANHAPEVAKSNNWKNAGWNPELLLELFDQLVLPEAASNEKTQNLKV